MAQFGKDYLDGAEERTDVGFRQKLTGEDYRRGLIGLGKYLVDSHTPWSKLNKERREAIREIMRIKRECESLEAKLSIDDFVSGLGLKWKIERGKTSDDPIAASLKYPKNPDGSSVRYKGGEDDRWTLDGCSPVFGIGYTQHDAILDGVRKIEGKVLVLDLGRRLNYYNKTKKIEIRVPNFLDSQEIYGEREADPRLLEKRQMSNPMVDRMARLIEMGLVKPGYEA